MFFRQLCFFSPLDNEYEYLPTKNVIVVKAIGTVKLNQHVILHLVLFILEYKVNDIFISSFTNFTK